MIKLSAVYVNKNLSTDFSPVFANIPDALDYIAKIRREGAYQPVSVRLTDPEYELSEPVVIGSNVYDVTIEPYSAEKVLISGGIKVPAFVRDNFNGVDCLSAYLPEIKSGSLRFTDLYVNGKRAKSTRYPKEGFLRALDVENRGGRLFDSSKWFIADKKDLAPITDIGNCIVSFCHYWIDEHSPVENYDGETGKLTMKYSSRFGITNEFSTEGNFEYYIENSCVGFGGTNEWYVDYSTGKIYYVPDSEGVREAYIPITDKLFIIKGTEDNKVRGIKLRNLKFANTRGDYASVQGVHGESQLSYASDSQAVANAHGSVEFIHAHACAVMNSEICNFGVHAFNIMEGCDRITISGNNIHDGGGGGVRINGTNDASKTALATHGNIITNNVIASCGRRYLAACGILIMNSYENVVSHNEISDLFYTGISCGWVWGYADSITRDNLITKNHIHHLGQGALSDMGGIYLLGKQPGTVVSNNVIHDVRSNTYGGWALYTDEGSSYITLENNICYNVSNNCYHQHYGSFNTVRNNIFAFADAEMIKITRFEGHLSIIFENNLILSNGSPIYGFDERFITESGIGLAGNIVCDLKNSEPVFFNGKTIGKLDLTKMQSYGLETGSSILNPGFNNAEKFDFSLPDDSPVYKLGFRKIDTGDVGVIR